MNDDAQHKAFHSVSAVRDANRRLLDELADFEQGAPSPMFLDKVEAFRLRAVAAGAYFSAVEDRAEAQSIVNFWLTVLFNNSRTGDSLLLKEFDNEAAHARVGDVSPYKGLDPFQVEDSDYFFGRHKVISAMLGTLAESRLLAVTGLSGSGKSSAVRAGLIPRLRDGAIGGSSEWLIPDPIVPGKHPIAALSAVTALVSRDAGIATPSDLTAALDQAGRVVLISIDQFEELFTITDSDQERQLFLDALVDAVTHGEHHHIVLITMRSEYDAQVEKHPAFADLFNAGRIPIAALSARELRTAIEQPAAQVGVRFESGLVDDLVLASVGEPAGLPLLQFALLELWKHRSRDNLITLDSYRVLGGSPRAILASRATAIYEDLLPEDQNLSRSIFLSLVQIGAGLEATSRRVTRSELAGPRDNVDRVLAIWRENGLIRVSPPGKIRPDSQVEVAHEALIRNWDMLRDWIDDEFASTRRRRVLTERARAWREKKDTLLGELSLQEADQLDDLSAEETEYVEASRVRIDRAQRAIRQQKRLALLAGVAGVALLLVGVSGWKYGYEQYAALAEQKQTERERLGRATLATMDRAKNETRAQIDRLRGEWDGLVRQRNTLRVQLGEATRQREIAARAHREMMGRTAAAAAQQAEMLRARDVARQERDVAQREGELAVEARDQALAVADQALAAVEGERLVRLEGNRLGTLTRDWSVLNDQRPQIETASRAVGRLQTPEGTDIAYLGTVFLIADGVAAIPTIMIEGSATDLTIDFRAEPDDDRRAGFRVESVIGETSPSEDDFEEDAITLVRVAGRNDLNESLPEPLRLAEVQQRDDSDSAPAEQDDRTDSGDGQVGLYPGLILYGVSYPSRDSRIEEAAATPSEVLASRFLEPEGVKRLSPGILLRSEVRDGRLELRHNGMMLRGSTGAPIIDLASGRVIGIHLGAYLRPEGGQGSEMFAAPITPYFLNSPAAREARLRADGPAAR